MAITITAGQRDLLYEDILIHLSGLDGIEIAFRNGEFELAQELCELFADELRIMNESLGWNLEHENETVELKTSADVLRRVLPRRRSVALTLDESEETERAELKANGVRNLQLAETCSEILKNLASDPSAVLD